MKKIFSFLFLLTALIGVSQVPTPAGPQTKPILITGATVHTGTGQVIENGAVAFENGKLTYVGATASAPADRAKYDVINAQGKHVYPGFIMTNSILGLIEIESFRATADNTETGSLNPNVRGQVGYSTDSEITPTYRFNGILLAEIT